MRLPLPLVICVPIYICSFNQPPYVVLTNPPLPENDEKMIIIIITIILPFPKAPFFLNNALDQRIVQNNGITLSSHKFTNNESLVTPGQYYERLVIPSQHNEILVIPAQPNENLATPGQFCLPLPSSRPPWTCSSSSSRHHLPAIGNVPRWESKTTNSICCSLDHKYFLKILKLVTCIIKYLCRSHSHWGKWNWPKKKCWSIPWKIRLPTSATIAWPRWALT